MGIAIEELSSKRYEPNSIDLDNFNDSRSLTINLVGYNKNVLEVGTSTGYVTKILKERGNLVIGMEIDEDASKIARQYCTKMIVGDIESIDLGAYIEESSLDTIIFGDVLEHLKSPASTLTNVKRYLRPDGYLVVSLPNVCHGDLLLNLLQGDFRYTSVGLLDATHLRFFGLKNIVDLFNTCGYEIVSLNRVIHPIGDTELKIDQNKIPRDFLEFIQSLPNSNVYQYVFKATIGNTSNKDLAPEISLISTYDATIGSMITKRMDLLKAEIAKQSEEIKTLEYQVSGLNYELRIAMDKSSALEREIAEIRRSIVWRLIMAYHRLFVETLMPQKTRRRKVYDRLLIDGRTIVNDGWESLKRKID